MSEGDSFDWIDVGVNLLDRAFDKDRDEVIARAFAAGVRRIILTGTDEDVSYASRDFARNHPKTLFSTAGLHPHYADQWNGKRSEHWLRDLCNDPQVVAIGECGLDFYRNISPSTSQRKCFEAQLEIAAELRLPVFIHERDAGTEVAEMLHHYRDSISKAIVHCFTGGRDSLHRYLDLGLYIGATGWICDERRGLDVAQLVGTVPADRLMIESDAPYLLPRSMPKRPKSRRNEPSFLPYVAAAVAESRGTSMADVAVTTTRVAERFFALPVSAPPTAPAFSRSD